MAKQSFDVNGEDVKVVNLGGVKPQLPVYNTPLPNLSDINSGPSAKSVDDIFTDAFVTNKDNRIESIPLSSISTDKRYPYVFRGSDPEEMYAQHQSWTEKAFNDTLKFTNLVGTTIAGGLGMVYGVGKWALPGGKFSDIFENDVMKGLDEWNTKVDNELLPNYYTQLEKQSEWYDTDNWLTSNFWFDKVMKNAGFAVGAMLSGNIANGIVGGTGAAIGEWTAARALAAESSQAFKLFTPLLRSTSRAFSAGKNIEAAQLLTSEISSIADITNKSQKLFNVAKEANKYAGINDFGRKLVISAYSSAGEASFEALNTSKHFREKLIDDYFYENGKMPVGEDLDKINDLSGKVGATSFLGNMALLSVTEFNQLPYLMGSSYKNSKRVANSLIGETDDVLLKEGKYTINAPTTRRGKLYKGALEAGKKLATGKSTYLFDTKESLQEVAQYALEIGTQNYFNKAYKGQEAQNIIEQYIDIANYGLFGKDETGKSVGALISKEGIESGIIGGLTGGPMQAKQLYAENKQKKANTEALIEKLNSAPSLKEAFIDKINSVNRGVQLQKEQQDAIINGDKLEYYDLKADILHNYLAPRVKFGKFDMIMEDLGELKQMAYTSEGLASLKEQGYGNINDNIDTFTSTINQIESAAKTMEEMYSYVNLTYGGQTVTGEDGKEYKKYSNDVLDKMVYASTKISNYDKRIPLLSESLLKEGITVNDAISEMMSNPDSDAMVQKLAEIDTLDPNIYTQDKKDQLKKDLLETFELSLRRKQFVSEYNDIIAKPENFKSSPDFKYSEEVIDESSPKETISIKTKDGVRDIEIDTEYFVGKGVDYEKEGLDSPIPISKLTIVGENKDGTIKIKTDSGEIRDISKKVLENYKLGKVASLKANKTANFFYNHRNDLYEYNFGKNFGGVKQGRLEFQDGKLYFVYLNEEGKVDKKQLFNSHFVAQEGYEKARVTKVGNVKSETAEQQVSREAFTSPEELAKQKQTLAKNREARLEILSQLEKETTERLEEVNKKLLSKVEELTKIEEDLAKIAELKEGQKVKGNFSKVLSTSVRTLNRYAKMKNNVDQEIAKLRGEQEELEMNISYFQDFANNLEDLPENTGEFLKELRDQIKWLTDLGKQTAESLSALEKLSKQLTDAIKNVARILKDSLNKFDSEYADYISEALDNVINSEDPTSGLAIVKEYLADYALSNDLVKEISINTTKLEDISEQAKEIKAKLDEFRNEYKSKKIIVDRFQKIFDEYKKQKLEEDKLFADEAVVKKALSTEDKGIPSRQYDKDFEADPKKSNEIVPRATTPKEEGKPHQVRANAFGVKLNSLPNRKDIRGVYVTSKNQNQLLPGVVERMLDNDPELIKKYKDSMIILVMVNTKGELVGLDGQPIAPGTELLDAAIYQAFPEGKMRDGSLFRATTPQDVRDAIIAQYETWRKGVLAQNTIGHKHEIEASFGIIENVKDASGNTVYSTRTSVESAGLITAGQLESSQLIFIPKTNNKVSKGTVSYDSALGMVFLETPNGYTKLQNRKHTQAEASAIFDAMLLFAKNMINPQEGTDSDSSKRALRFLQGTTYWGIPKDQQGNRKEKDGYSSLFFEKSAETGRLTIMIGGKDTGILFTPSAMTLNKETLISQIGQIYTNTNSAFAQDLNEKFEQIISISPEGEIKSELWNNYQTYLLSDVKPDGSERKDYELPLSTTARPLVAEGDVNRRGIYFFTTDTADDFVVPAPKKTIAKTLTPGAPKPVTATPAAADEFAMEFTYGEEATPSYKLDGTTTNTYTSPEGKKILFRAPATTTLDNYAESITIMQGGDLAEIVKKIEDAGKDPKDIIKKTIYNAIAQDLTKLAAEQEMEFEFTMPGDVVEEAEKEVGKPLDQDVIDAINSGIDDGNDEAHRVAIESEVNMFEPENWNDVEKWLKANFPNIPVYRVKNIIQATNGRQAWGMLKDGAIYLYQNAEVGTAYHEVFEAVWKMFTDATEQEAIRKEFNSRKGTFVDRPTGKTIKYSEATPEQAKEQLAEEFRDYIMTGKIPAKPSEGKPFIVKLFADIVSFFKQFFFGKTAVSNTEELFKKIGNGYYKQNMPYATKLSMAKEGIIDVEDAFGDSESEFRLTKISDKEGADIIQHMTYLTLTNLIGTDRSLFTRDAIPSSELYAGLKTQILQTINQKNISAEKLLKNDEYLKDNREEKTRIIKDVMAKNTAFMQNVSDEWPTIVERHKEYLRGYQIEFDENDNVAINDLEKSKDEGFGDASKIDSFKKANPAIKLLLSTIPVVNPDNPSKLQLSSIGGAILIPTSKTYISLMSNLHDASSIEDMLEKLRVMAENDPNYRTLYKRITKRSFDEEGVDLSRVDTTHGLQLISALWKTFKKQNPEVKNVFILENGDVVVGDASLSNAANQLRSEYINNIVTYAKGNKGFFRYDETKKVFVGDQAKIKEVKLDSITAMVDFLNKLGIPFTASEVVKLQGDQLNMFKDAVSGIRKSISETKEIATFSGKVLDISNRLLELGLVKATISNPEFNSTYFNVSGERTQSFIGTNAASDLYTFLSKINNISEIADTKYSYLLTDSFAQNSNLMQRMFGKDGARKQKTGDLFKIGYVSGTINESNGKQKPSSKLTFPERLIQEMNLNLSGWYLNLIPGDASLEWMIKMGNPVSSSSISRGMGEINEIFKGYFLSELALSRETDRPVAAKRNRKDLRFFKDILGKELHDEIIASEEDVETVYALNENKINDALMKYINSETSKYGAYLKRYGILQEGMTGFTLKNVNLPKNMSNAELSRQLSLLTVNFMINNIEMHKLLYADPYQYDDELKRIKSFNSPRQSIISDSPKMNAAFSNVWNKGFKKGDIGYTEFTQDYFKTATHEDVVGVIDLPGYGGYKETDGSGIIGMKSNRQFRIRAGEWNENEERQYRYDIAWEKEDKGIKLSKEEQALLAEGNPQVKSAYTPLKPIVSGAKLAADGQPKNINDIVLDKYALYPLSYRIMKELSTDSNAIKLYNKMQNENIDYIVFKSARKVGSEALHSTYDKQTGEFNNNPYKGVINVPFSIMSVQSEVPSKDVALVTRGSQVTKLITLDYLAAGVPIDFFPGKDFDQRYKAWNKLTSEQQLEKSPIFKEVKDNQVLLNEIMEEGFNTLLDTLGIVYADGEFKVNSFDKAVNTLRNEVLKREVNDNISDALTGFLEGKSVLEATPAGQQIKNILYSIADREVISPKISGGMKVQIPSTLLESTRTKETEINGKKGFTSDALAFYEDKDGKRVCEIMVGRWFKSDMSDADLLEYLNKTEEGQKILSGLAFRIPTQKQNSIDAFVIKQFLPKEFGDSVVVPAALVEKVGSDFDIDKLSIYLKNIYENKEGNVKLVPFLGYGEKAKAKFAEMFDQGEFITKDEMAKIEEYIANNKQPLTDELSDKLINSIFGEAFDNNQALLEDYLANTTKEEFKSRIVNKLYKQSLENAYIQSSQNLVSHPSNFDKLIQPNSAAQLKALGNFIAEKTVGQSFDYSNVGNMLDRRFMARLRHAFVTGKYAIGIAAVNQTNHSLNQRQATYIDDTKLNKLSKDDRHWIGDAKVKFEKFNQITIEGKGLVPTLSMIKNADGQDISDILGQFIDGYVDISAGPWIMELGATPNVASTFMFLVKIGVPIDTVAYFMNQPIIYDYLNNIENAGYSWLFIEDFVKEIKKSGKYAIPKETKVIEIDQIPSKSILKENVGKETFNIQERAQQQFMLDEFLKYAKMGEQLFLVTQGSNYDTATLNDGLLIWKKDQQLAKAQNTIISSVDDILDNSHIGSIRTKAGQIRQALAEILSSDKSRVRNVIQKVLTPYINMNDRDFLKTGQKVQNDLFDWAVQTDQKFNNELREVLIEDGGYAKDILDFVNKVKKDPKHPLYNNHVINIIESDPSKKASENTPKNIKVKGLDNKVYDQNNIIYAFREIRDYLNSQNKLTGENNQLYNNLVTLAVLQSGLSNSPISFTSVLPYEDFEKIYNKTLSKLESIPNLDDFYELGVFQRNNWSNDDVVPYKRAIWIDTDSGRKYNPSMSFLPAAVREAVEMNTIPPVMSQSMNSRESAFDFIVYTWEKREDLLTKQEMENYEAAVAQAGLEGKPAPKLSNVINAKKAEMRKAGDYSFINKGLFQKVVDDYGTPLTTIDKKDNEYFVYKAVNAWGDSYRANEFYDVDKKSVFDNGFMQVEDVDNNVIITKFLEKPAKNTVQKKATLIEVYDKIDDDSYSLSLQYGTGKYDLVLSRNGEVVDPSFYNPSTLKDVDVDPGMFKFTKEDLEAIFKQLDQEEQSWKEEDNNDTCNPF